MYLLEKKIFLARFLIFLSLVWISIGFFPILNLESDSALFNAGCERLFSKELELPPSYFYEWNMQPLTGLIIVLGKSFFRDFSCEQIYSVLTFILSIGYIFLCSVFISKLIKLQCEYCFLILILFPESYSISYYPNTAIFAAVISLIGFLLILKKPLNLISIILLGLAPLCRIDVVAVYPVVFFILIQKNDFGKALKLSILYALCVVIICFAGFYLLKANPFETLRLFSDITSNNSHEFDFGSFIRVNFTFFSIAILIMILHGSFHMFKSKATKLLLLSYYPIIILYLINKDFFGAAPKHILYLLPFAGVLASYSLVQIKDNIQQKKYFFIITIGIFILIQNLLAIRIYPENKPWLNKPYSLQYSTPRVLSFKKASFPIIGDLEIGLGAGQVVPTADELMLLSGNLFTPFYQHHIKQLEQKERAVLKKIIFESPDTLYFMTTQASDWQLSQQLHNLGFQIQNSNFVLSKSNFSSNFIFKNGKKTVIVSCYNLTRDSESFNSAIEAFDKKVFYLYVLWDWQLYFINENKTLASPLSYQLSIYRKRL